jgi:hypothetical protein
MKGHFVFFRPGLGVAHALTIFLGPLLNMLNVPHRSNQRPKYHPPAQQQKESSAVGLP